MTDNSKDATLVKVYEDKANGLEFYAHQNPMDISPVRGVAAERKRRFLDMNITQKTLKELIQAIKTEAGAGDIVKAFSIVQEIEYRLEFICEEDSILDFVCIYYMLKDEDPKTYNELINEKKMKFLRENEAARSFFLTMGLSLIEKFSKLPEVDLSIYLEYMKEIKEKADRIYSRGFISRNG